MEKEKTGVFVQMTVQPQKKFHVLLLVTAEQILVIKEAMFVTKLCMLVKTGNAQQFQQNIRIVLVPDIILLNLFV